MTALQSLLSALVRDARLRQIAIAERAGLSTKHLSQMLNGRVEGTLTMWQAVLDAAGISLPPYLVNIDQVEAAAYEAGWNDCQLQQPCTDGSDFERLGRVAARRIRDRRMAGALEELANDWRRSADEDEQYLTRANAPEIHDVNASIRINREHAAAVTALLKGKGGS